MQRRFDWHRLILTGLLFALAGSAFGQLPPLKTPAPVATPTPAAASPAPTIIPDADIPDQADSDDVFAQGVLRRATGRDPIAALEPRLAKLAKSVGDENVLFQNSELNLFPVARLESIERHWLFFEHQYAAWRADFKEISGRNVQDAAELGRRREAWAATIATPDAQMLPPALLARIQAVQKKLHDAEQALSAPIDRQIRLSQRGNALKANIDAGQAAMAAAVAYSDSRLLRIDAPPLWSIRNTPPASDPNASIESGLARETAFIADYSAATELRSRAFNLLMLALLPVLIWLSVRSRRSAPRDPSLEPAMRVLRRPFSSWLLLLSTGVLVVHPDAPQLLRQTALFLALVPVLRLLPSRVFDLLGPWPYAATGLYLIDLFGFAVLGNPYLHRYYLLLLTLTALGLILLLKWRGRHRTVEATRTALLIDRIVHQSAWFAVVVLSVSVVANAFGNVSLAEMLTDAVLVGSYVGLMLYAGLNVVLSMLQVLMLRRSPAVSLVAQHADSLLHGIGWLLRLIALTGWLVVVLNEFRVFRPLYRTLAAILTHEFNFGVLTVTLGNIVTFALSVVLAFWIARTVRYLLNDEVLPKMPLPRGIANSIATLSYYALILIGLFIALAAAGFQIAQLTIVLGALGVGIGLGLQHVVNNFVSGLILMFERPIQPGDVVEITGTSGRVREIGMRATTLTTFEGADVVVPNGTILSEKLTNWTLSNQNRRMDVAVGVAYKSDPSQVLALLMDVAKATPGVATHPKPSVIFQNIGDSALNFNLRAWTNDYDDWVETRSNLTVRVYAALVAAGIEMPYPQRDLNLRSVSDDVQVALRGTPQSGEDTPSAPEKPPR